jgi:hypothetical protein
MKKVLFLIVLSLFLVQCDNTKKGSLAGSSTSTSASETQGTSITDSSGKVLVTDGTATVGSTIPGKKL